MKDLCGNEDEVIQLFIFSPKLWADKLGISFWNDIEDLQAVARKRKPQKVSTKSKTIFQEISKFYAGLRYIIKQSSTSSTPSENYKHLKAKLNIENNFKIHKNIPKAFESRIWLEITEPFGKIKWRSESDIKSYVNSRHYYCCWAKWYNNTRPNIFGGY